jgi:hypothetical protein
MAKENETRPAVLDRASETQIQELEQQFEQGDRNDWKVLTDSYGWSAAESQAVWDWFGADPEKGTAK